MLLRAGIEEAKVEFSTQEAQLFLSISCCQLELKGAEIKIRDLLSNTAKFVKEMLGVSLRGVAEP